MKRYLLFDSNCLKCTKIAQAIEREVEGSFAVRSLRDSNIQDLLDRANPDWSWKPTLLEVGDDETRAYTGPRMGLQLVLVLGLRRAFRLMKLLGRYASVLQRDAKSFDPSRRRFLRQSGALMTAMPLLMGLSTPWETTHRKASAQSQAANFGQTVEQQTETWKGFALLPTWDSPLPEFVQQAPMPIMGKAGGPTVEQFRPDIKHFDTIEELIGDLSRPFTYPTEFPWDVELTSAETTRFVGSGNVHNVILQFETPDQPKLVRLTTSFIYSRPYPIRPVPSPVLRMEKIIYPEKISFTPSPGVGLFTETSDHVFWIERGVLYFLHVEPKVSREQLRTIIDSLVQG